MFVTVEDFDLPPYNIPNVDKVANTFNAYIKEKEDDVLRKILGDTLYDAFIDGIDQDYPEDRWLNLRDGVTYPYSSFPYKWGGLKKLLVPYIYSEWIKDGAYKLSGIGHIKAKAENSEVVSSAWHICQAWNDFARRVGTRLGCYYWQYRRRDAGTLYGYLRATDFEDVAYLVDLTFDSYLYRYDFPELKNTYGL